MTSSPRVFVSDNHQDNAYCREFVAALRQKLVSDEAVWYDEHNMGWGQIRREIERELAQRQHFIAILSPVAVDSDWVNDEIDAAVELRRRGSMQTIQFVIALQCEMPLLLSNYKRVIAPDGLPYPAQEAARRALAVIQPTPPEYASAIPQASLEQANQLIRKIAEQQSQAPKPISIPSDRFPPRLADLGFTAHSDKGIEYILPPLCTVIAGPFLMGSVPSGVYLDDSTDSDDHFDAVYQRRQQRLYTLQHTVTLPAYEIARFPVTVAEFACFVRFGHVAPRDWHAQLGKLDHPVVNVTWQDAVDFAYWLSVRTSQSWWRLPTEAEWEKAARGTDGRIYPWGDSFDKSPCNTSESSISAMTPIGNFPTGASPYGLHEVAGNVWGRTSSRFISYPYTISGEREYPNSADYRVLRGGSWRDSAVFARAAYRLGNQPLNIYGCDGFRLVRAAPNS